jgi:hypothetical protein
MAYENNEKTVEDMLLSIQGQGSQPETPAEGDAPQEDNTPETQEDDEPEGDAPEEEPADPRAPQEDIADELFSLDRDEEEPAATQATGNTAPTLDYKPVSQALGLEDASPEQLLAAINTLKQAQAKPVFADPDLEVANQIAEAGGEHLEYLGLVKVDYNQIDDETLLRHELAQYFEPTEEGAEELEDYLDAMPPQERRIKAQQTRAQLSAQKDQRLNQIKREAEEKRLKADKALRDTLDKTDRIKTFKYSPADKKKAYERITKGDFVRDIFYNKDGSYNFEKAVMLEFLDRNFDKMYTHFTSQAQKAGERKLMGELQNQQLEKPNAQPREAIKVDNPVSDFMAAIQEERKRSLGL